MKKFNERLICGYLTSPQKLSELEVLLNFYDEVSYISLKTKDAAFMQIRLKWFIEALEKLFKRGEKSGYPLVDNLQPLINKYSLPLNDFINLLEARTVDKDYLPFNNPEEYLKYAENTGGSIWKLVMAINNGAKPEQKAAFFSGAAFAAVGIIRNINFDLKRLHYPLIFNKEIITAKQNLATASTATIKTLLPKIKEYIEKANIIKVKANKKRLLLLNVFTKGYLNNIEKNLNDITKLNPFYLPFKYKILFFTGYLTSLV